MLEDLNSSNGTFIGEFQAARRILGSRAIKEGEIFRAGLTRLRLGGDRDDHAAIADVAAAAHARRSRTTQSNRGQSWIMLWATFVPHEAAATTRSVGL